MLADHDLTSAKSTCWYLYRYEHIDWRDYEHPPEKVVDYDGRRLFSDERVSTVKGLLRRAGWEGDGALKLIWLPPFLFEGGDTFGCWVFHVKQFNNGTSWLACDQVLRFPALELVSIVKLASEDPFRGIAPPRGGLAADWGCVYLLRAENGLYKIGKAQDASARSTTIGLIVPFEITLVHSIDTAHKGHLERALHLRFADKRVRGEWFRLEPADVDWLTSFTAWPVRS